MIDFLLNLFSKKTEFTGAILKPIENEIKFKEIVAMANPVIWKEKSGSEWRSFPAFNQKASFMCGAFSAKKILGILYWLKYNRFLEFSEEHIYKRRGNKPNAGMWEEDIYRILEEGTTLKVLTGANIKTDEDADFSKIEVYAEDVGKIFKTGKRISVPIDIEQIASVIQTTGKPVLLTSFFTSNEWSQKFPKIILSALNAISPNALRHYIVAVDFGLIDGKRYLKIEDSAWFGGLNERWIDSLWVSNRIYGASYPMTFKFIQGDKVRFNGSVESVQDIFKSEGYFPTNVTSTGYWGTVTTEACKQFQTAHNLTPTGKFDDKFKRYLLENYF